MANKKENLEIKGNFVKYKIRRFYEDSIGKSFKRNYFARIIFRNQSR